MRTAQPDPVKCQAFVRRSQAEAGAINMYAIYADVCTARANTSATRLAQALADAGVAVGQVVGGGGGGGGC
jgi:hypothetical protein